MGRLVLKLPDGRTREIPLDRERITIGRRADNDVCLPFPAVSAEHAAVVTVLDDSFLEDLNSTNGTLVNGKPVAKHFLRERDEIDIGRQVLVYLSGGAGATSKPAATAGAAPTHAHAAESPSRGGNVDTTPLLRGPAAEPPVAQRPDGAGGIAGVPPVHPTFEVLEGPGAGRVVAIDRDEFVIGRVGRQVAAVRRTPDGLRLEHVEGDAPPRINGAALPDEGSLLALGDEIEIAGARLRFHRAG